MTKTNWSEAERFLGALNPRGHRVSGTAPMAGIARPAIVTGVLL